MKRFKGVIYFLIIMFMAILLAAVFAPGKLIVSRKMRIDAPIEVVFAQVVELEKWQKWDAWHTDIASEKRSYRGTVGDKEYGFSWSPSEQEFQPYRISVNDFKNNEEIAYTMLLTILNRKVTAQGMIHFSERNGHTEVEWILQSEQMYPYKIVNYFIDQSLGPDFEKGLTRLKKYVETSSLDELGMPENGVIVQEEHGTSYALLANEQVPLSELTSFLSDGYQDIYKYFKLTNTKPKGAPTGLFYEGKYSGDRVHLAAAVPTSVPSPLVDSTIRWPGAVVKLGSNHITTIHNGGYASIAQSHKVLQSWMEKHDKIYKAPAVEQYLKGPLDDADTSLHVTRVIYYFE